MRFTVRLFFFWVSVFLIFYLAVIGVVYLFWRIHIDFWQAALVFFLVGIIPPGVITAYFFRRLDYMESEKRDPPPFTGQKKACFQFKARTTHPFDEVLQRIDRQWIISFSDRKNRVLKFRTDARMQSWGVGGYLSMTDDGTVEVIVYPIHP
ncbi:MAG: hypothetical protein WC126_05795, partial [Proteiniphilum sp.]